MMAFRSGVRPWVRGTLAKIAASTAPLGQGELLVDETGGVYGGDGATAIKDLSPALTRKVAAATYPAKQDAVVSLLTVDVETSSVPRTLFRSRVSLAPSLPGSGDFVAHLLRADIGGDFTGVTATNTR